VPCGFLVLKAGVTREHAEIERDRGAGAREEIRPVAAFKLAITVRGCRKTRSGKICAAPSRRSPDGDEWRCPRQ